MKYAFLGLLCVITGAVAAGQILGFAGLYTPGLVLAATILACGLCWLVVRKSTADFTGALLAPEGPAPAGRGLVRWPAWAEGAGYAAGLLLLVAVLALPLVLWPYDAINEQLTWDAGLYHLPKAAMLLVSHSSWDLSIAYGEYPLGYELLVALSLALNRAGLLIGAVHALILVFFCNAFYLLCCRYTRIPRGALFFGAVFLVASYDLVRSISSNPFQVLRVQAFVIGKNDFFLAAGGLALLVFSPVGPRWNAALYSLPGMALTSLLVAATKPNGAPILVAVWLIALAHEIGEYRREHTPWREMIRRWALPVIASLIGVLWAVRNIIAQGRLFSAGALEIQQYSILNNLSNPYLYNYLDLYLKEMLALFGVTLLLGLVWKSFHWSIPLAFGVQILAFAATPASAFFGSTQQPSQIAWRLGLFAVAYMAPILLAILDPLAVWVFTRGRQPLAGLVSLGMVAFSAWGTYPNLYRLHLNPANAIVLQDQFHDPVGAGGYFSAYDYVRRNVRGSVVWVENGLPFYVFGPGLTNTITRTRKPDYYLIFQNPGSGLAGYPEMTAAADWDAKWRLVYTDSRSRVYERK
jgi:hypothetical protein